MFALIKTSAIATVGGMGLLASFTPTAATVGAMVGIASLVGGVGAVSTLRAQLTAAKNTIALSNSERDILAEKCDRQEKRLIVLEAQPNLEQHAELLKGLTGLVLEQGHMLRAVHTAVVPPRE